MLLVKHSRSVHSFYYFIYSRNNVRSGDDSQVPATSWRTKQKRYAVSSNYLWTCINNTEMEFKETQHIKVNLHDVAFILPRQLPGAVALRGDHQWIDISASTFLVFSNVEEFIKNSLQL